MLLFYSRVLRIKIIVVFDTKSFCYSLVLFLEIPSPCCNPQYFLAFLSHCGSCYSAALLGAASPTEARDAVARLASAVCSALHHPPQSISEGSFLDNLYVYPRLEVLCDYSPTGVIWTPQDYSSLRPLKICLPAFSVFQLQLSRKLEQEGRTWYNGILFRLIKQWISDTHYTWMNHEEWNKLDTKGQILCDFTYMKYLK